MSSPCLFCRIAAGEEPSHTVFTDEVSMAFLDHRPLFEGHCLLIPKAHFETFADLAVELVGPLFEKARLLSMAIEQGLGVDGTFVGMNNRVSQSVPHVHIHIVPRRRKDGLRGFFWPRQKYPDIETMQRTQEIVSRAMARML
ncbi:MAG: HIT family protein [Acidobacteriota bacterium]